MGENNNLITGLKGWRDQYIETFPNSIKNWETNTTNTNLVKDVSTKKSCIICDKGTSVSKDNISISISEIGLIVNGVEFPCNYCINCGKTLK